MFGLNKHKPTELFPERLSKNDLQNFDNENQEQKRQKAQAKIDFLNTFNNHLLKVGDLAIAEKNDSLKYEDLSPETIFNFCPKDENGQPLLSPDELMDALGLTIEFLSTHDPITVPTDTGKSLYYPVPAIQELFFIRQIHTENNHNPVVVDTFSLSMPEVIQKSKLTMDKSLSSIDQSALPPTEDEIEAMRKMVDNENEE